MFARESVGHSNFYDANVTKFQLLNKNFIKMRKSSALRFVIILVPLFVIIVCYNFLGNRNFSPATYLHQLNYCGPSEILKGNETLSRITRCSCVMNNASNDYKSNGSHAASRNINAMSLELFDYVSLHLRETPYPGVFNYTNYVTTRMNLKPLEGVKPLTSDLILPVFNDVTSFEYVASPAPCVASNGSEINVFVAIVSSPANFEKRNATRHAWLMTLNDELNVMKSADEPLIKVVGKSFVVGQSVNSTINKNVMSESATNGDIISIDMLDSYYNLSVKAVGLLIWLFNKCSSVDYVLKVDDDVYVNTRKLGGFIRQLNASEVGIYGTVTDGIVLRGISMKPRENLLTIEECFSKDGKWGLPYECYPWNTYPRYYQGAAVLMAGSAVGPLLSAAQTIPYHPIDDLYLTGFCAERAGVSLLSTYR